jgi:hypothetical protein
MGSFLCGAGTQNEYANLVPAVAMSAYGSLYQVRRGLHRDHSLIKSRLAERRNVSLLGRNLASSAPTAGSCSSSPTGNASARFGLTGLRHPSSRPLLPSCANLDGRLALPERIRSLLSSDAPRASRTLVLLHQGSSGPCSCSLSGSSSPAPVLLRLDEGFRATATEA